MVTRYAVLRDGLVENVVLWDGGSDWAPPQGTTVAQAPPAVGPGWQVSGDGTFTPPSAPPPDPLARSLAVLQQLVDPKQTDPSQADFSAAVADVLLSLAE